MGRTLSRYCEPDKRRIGLGNEVAPPRDEFLWRGRVPPPRVRREDVIGGPCRKGFSVRRNQSSQSQACHGSVR